MTGTLQCTVQCLSTDPIMNCWSWLTCEPAITSVHACSSRAFLQMILPTLSWSTTACTNIDVSCSS